MRIVTVPHFLHSPARLSAHRDVGALQQQCHSQRSGAGLIISEATIWSREAQRARPTQMELPQNSL